MYVENSAALIFHHYHYHHYYHYYHHHYHEVTENFLPEDRTLSCIVSQAEGISFIFILFYIDIFIFIFYIYFRQRAWWLVSPPGL